MKTRAIFLPILAMLALSACGTDPEPTTSNSAEDFAARINGAGGAAPAATNGDGNAPPTTGDEPRPIIEPTVAAPLPKAAEGVFAPGTATDPAALSCDASNMGPFIGRVADAGTRVDIEDTAAAGREIRFLRPGEASFTPDPTSSRLNIMLDAQDIIRDARCG